MSLVQALFSNRIKHLIYELLSWNDSKQLRNCSHYHKKLCIWYNDWNIYSLLSNLCVGSKVDAQDSHGQWYESSILDYTLDHFNYIYYINIHYCAWNDEWNEHICSIKEIRNRIAKLHTHTYNYRGEYAIGKLYEYRNINTKLWHMGIITYIDDVNNLLKINSYNNVYDKPTLIHKDSDNICDINTHIKLSYKANHIYNTYLNICYDYYDKRNLYQLLYTNQCSTYNIDLIPIIIEQKRNHKL